MFAITFFCISLIFLRLSFSFWLNPGGADIEPMIDPNRSMMGTWMETSHWFTINFRSKF